MMTNQVIQVLFRIPDPRCNGRCCPEDKKLARLPCRTLFIVANRIHPLQDFRKREKVAIAAL
jgi:hypothetical protein